MSETNSENPPQVEPSPPSSEVERVEHKSTPSKRARISIIERAQRESEELIKNMGGSLDVEGGRKTRSSTRGTPSKTVVASPPPAKKPKAATPRRGRPKRVETPTSEAANDEENASETQKKTDDTVDEGDENKKAEKSEDAPATTTEPSKPADVGENSVEEKTEVDAKNEKSEKANVESKNKPELEEKQNEIISLEESDDSAPIEIISKDESTGSSVEAMEVDAIKKSSTVAETVQAEDVQNSNKKDSKDNNTVCTQKDVSVAGDFKKTETPYANSIVKEHAAGNDVSAEESKNEKNDHCAPKKSSSPSSATDAVTAAQFCN